jgi:hypothetical protein
VLHPWLPDHAPALMSVSPRDWSGLLLCFMVQILGRAAALRKGPHFDLG